MKMRVSGPLCQEVWTPMPGPQSVSEFLTRVVAIDRPLDAIAVTTQKLEGPSAPSEGISITFDIDVFRQGEFGVSGDELTPILQRLRGLKNTIFFSLLTEEAVELFQ